MPGLLVIKGIRRPRSHLSPPSWGAIRRDEVSKLDQHRYPGRPSLAAVKQIARRALSRPGELRLTPIESGVSTWVYRLQRGNEIFYLRIWPDVGQSFAPEALVHHLVRERGVRAPEVLHCEHCDPLVDRSVMLTTEILGRPTGYDVPAADLRPVLVAAGRDMARINSVPVAGFGWIRREPIDVTRLLGTDPTHAAFVRAQIAEYVPVLEAAGLLPLREQRALARLVADAERSLHVEQAWLAHGDLDATHIFHTYGIYTGIIDFGEIRGADRWYDLGHLYLNNPAMLPFVLEGYAQETQLPADHMEHIQLWSLLIAVRRLGRRVIRRPAEAGKDPDLTAIRRVLAELTKA